MIVSNLRRIVSNLKMIVSMFSAEFYISLPKKKKGKQARIISTYKKESHLIYGFNLLVFLITFEISLPLKAVLEYFYGTRLA